MSPSGQEWRDEGKRDGARNLSDRGSGASTRITQIGRLGSRRVPTRAGKRFQDRPPGDRIDHHRSKHCPRPQHIQKTEYIIGRQGGIYCDATSFPDCSALAAEQVGLQPLRFSPRLRTLTARANPLAGPITRKNVGTPETGSVLQPVR